VSFCRILGALLCAGLCVSGCGLGLQALPVGRTADGPSYRVTADFARADRIKLGTEVRIGQRIVGRVHDLSTDGHSAQIGLSLSESVPVPDNVAAQVELPSALGDPFIRLSMPASPSTGLLSEGSVIPPAQTQLGPDLESSMAILGMVLNGSGLDQLRTVITELNNAFGGRGENVKLLTERLNQTLGTIVQHQDDLNRALAAANTVAQQLADQQQVIDNGLDVAGPVLQLLISQRDKITALVDSTSALATQAKQVLGATSTQLGQGVDQTSQVLASIRGFNTEVGPALTNMNQFISRFSDAVKGDYLVFDGALDVPATISELVTGGKVPQIVVPQTLGDLLTGGAR
jgi:phospholipid/cholesterol/gamma-HCH transport system substrate-binding protein